MVEISKLPTEMYSFIFMQTVRDTKTFESNFSELESSHWELGTPVDKILDALGLTPHHCSSALQRRHTSTNEPSCVCLLVSGMNN